jgi:hypothetical protein
MIYYIGAEQQELGTTNDNDPAQFDNNVDIIGHTDQA